MNESRKSQPNLIYSYLMMAGHICCDMNQSMVPALLPFLVTLRGIDYASAAGLTFASSFLSSLIQPLLGMISDKKQRPWLMGAGILITGIGISAIGFIDNYWGIFAAVMFAGFGNAMFHPEGGRMANCVAGDKKGRAMSNFTVGGNIGFILGPIIAASVVTNIGLKGTAVILAPTLIIVAVLFAFQKKLKEISDVSRRETLEKTISTGQKDEWPAFYILCVSIFMRSIVQSGLQTFIPLYWVGVLMQTQQRGSLMVTIMALASAAAAFTGGRLADKYGFRRVIRIAFAAVVPLAVFLPSTNNVLIATAAAMILFGMNQVGHSPSVVLGQKYLSNRVGLASGITIGLAVSIGGICSPLLGMLGDAYGLTTVLYTISGVALTGFTGTLFIKKPAE